MTNRIEGSIRPLINVGVTLAATALGEQTIGRQIKTRLKNDINDVFTDPRFKDDDEEVKTPFMNKLVEIRPRMVGALSVYSALSGIPYFEIAKNKGIECFYIFWRMADGQDDLIDAPKRHNQNGQRPFKEKLFKYEGGEFFRGAIHLLEKKITEGKMGEMEKRYLKEKVSGWYRFLSDQEQRIQSEDFSSFDFNYYRKYREEQNQTAGEVLVALLNWDKCLDPNFQKLETIIPKFSFTTQMVDDIADTVEDVEAQRPSFAIGALTNNPEEFEKFLTEVRKRGIKKVHPSLLRKFAPQSYRLLREQFREYCLFLETHSGRKGRGFSIIANSVFLYFPSVRDFLFKLNPKIANF